MTGTKRKALIATVLGLAAATATIPMVISGTANAQVNARLCGDFWVSEDRGDEKGTGEVLVRLYEVSKDFTGKATCQMGHSADPYPKGFPGTIREQGRTTRQWSRNNFDMVVCEDWKMRDTRIGGLGGKDLNFIGDRFPKVKDQNDICNNMNRSESFLNFEIYWLYDDNLETPGVDFWREAKK